MSDEMVPPWLLKLQDAVNNSHQVSPADLRVSVYNVLCAEGFAAGRSIGVTITHIPSDTSVSSGSERSQWANRQKAFDELMLVLKKKFSKTVPVPEQTLLDACLELARHVEGRYPEGGRLPDNEASRIALDKVLRIAIASGLDIMGAM